MDSQKATKETKGAIEVESGNQRDQEDQQIFVLLVIFRKNLFLKGFTEGNEGNQDFSKMISLKIWIFVFLVIFCKKTLSEGIHRRKRRQRRFSSTVICPESSPDLRFLGYLL